MLNNTFTIHFALDTKTGNFHYNLYLTHSIMTKICFAFFLTMINFVAVSQDAQDELQMIKSLFGTDKDAIVKEFVKVEDGSKDQFNTLYQEFENMRKDLGQKKFKVLNSYVKAYNTLPEAELDEIMEEIIRLNSSQDKLIATYYSKIKKKCGVAVAAQFYQIEWYLLSEIRTAILENIPVINDLERRK